MIRLNDLVIGYDKPLMPPLNLKFEEGKIYGILGKSGCGKTTLLKTIAGLHPPIGGCVNKMENKCSRPIYMMCQRYTNFDWLTCVDNILITIGKKRARNEHRAEVEEILCKVGLGEYADRYPAELSGGMQQRLALARMLYVRPKYLLMDEPLSALDDSTRAKMQQLIIDTHNQTQSTIIMVTHSVEEARKMCDHIVQLNN